MPVTVSNTKRQVEGLGPAIHVPADAGKNVDGRPAPAITIWRPQPIWDCRSDCETRGLSIARRSLLVCAQGIGVYT
jgi:hypothetical protein